MAERGYVPRTDIQYLRRGPHTIEDSTAWTIFEPSDENRWSSLRLNTTTTLAGQWHQGALKATPSIGTSTSCVLIPTPPSSEPVGLLDVNVGQLYEFPHAHAARAWAL